MNSELREAAERVKRYLNKEELSSIYPEANGIIDLQVACINSDEELVNDAFLSFHDETPITEEWVEELIKTYESSIEDLCKQPDGSWRLYAEFLDVEKLKTRGQLKLLLLAMRVGE